MKVRAGFVSNSSSASFIVKWKVGGAKTVNAAIDAALDMFSYREESDSFDWEFGEHDKDMVEEIAANTKMIKKGQFESRFFTSMLNTNLDFGAPAAALMLGLMCSKDENDGKGKVEVVKVEVERDG